MRPEDRVFPVEHFELVDLGAPLSLEALLAELAGLREELVHDRSLMQGAIAERDRAQARVDELLSSTSWALTGPLRAIGRALFRGRV